LRLNLIKRFNNKHIIVDCPSIVGKNMPDINTHKINFLHNYIFNICPENSWHQGYVTEKLYEAMIAGCIPIYWGCDGLDDGFYNNKKILLLNKDTSNIESIVDKTINLINHKNELIDIISLNPFAIDRMDIIEDENKKILKIFQTIIGSI
jgi:hypothetical protein